MFEFAEVRLWELEPADYLAAGETALLLLIPLMGEQPSVEVLTQAVSGALRRICRPVATESNSVSKSLSEK